MLSPPGAISLRDVVRTSLQSAVAGGLTWVAGSALGSPHVSWAIISALYVVSQSVGASLWSGIGRMVGTLLGTAIGIASVWTLGGEDYTGLRVAIAALLASALVTFRPDWRYGIVAATIVAIEQDGNVLGGAIDRVLAILLGTAVGFAATAVVWPERATKRVSRSLSQAIMTCSRLLRRSVDAALGEEVELNTLHQQFLAQDAAARDAASSVGRKSRREDLFKRIGALERLWHALIILDRVAHEEHAFSLDGDDELPGALSRLRQSAADRLAALAGQDHAADGQADCFDDRLDEVTELIARSENASSGKRARGFAGLRFALLELGRNIRELEGVLDRD